MTVLASGDKPQAVPSVLARAFPPDLLDALAYTDELLRRPARKPDYESESRTLALLVQALADSPQTILQTLASAMLTVLDAGSAGISLLSQDEKHFVCPAIAGAWAPWAGGRMPRDTGPWGDALDHDGPLLFRRPEGRDAYLLQAKPQAEECLLLPFHVKGKAAGVIWAIAHEDRRKFDAEDFRQLQALGRFAAAAHQAGECFDAALRSEQAGERLNAELRDAEGRYRMLFESLDNGFCVIEKVAGIAGERPDFLFVEANPAFAVQSGMKDVLGKTLRQLFGDESGGWCDTYDAVCVSGKPIKFEREFVSQGRVLELYAFRVADKEPCRVAVNFQDITERKRAEHALRESEAFSYSILRSSPDCIKVLDCDGNLLAVPGRRQLGMEDFQPCPSASWLDFWTDEHRHSAQLAIKKAAAGQQGCFTGFFRTRRDEPKWWDVTVSPIRGTEGKVERLLAVSRDVTQRKLDEKILRQSEERFRAMAMASSDLMCRMSPDWREMLQVYDKNLIVDTTLINSNWLEIYVHRDDHPRMLALVGEAIRTKSLFEMEHRVRRADGSWGWMLSRAVPLLDADGEIVEWFGTGSDVTEHKRAEQALRESEERYRSLFDSIDEGFAIIEMIFDSNEKPVDYRFLQVNPSFENQSGLHGVTGRRVSEFLPDLEPSWFDFYGQVALTGTPMRIVSEVRSMDRWLDIYAARLGLPENRQVAVIFNNITQRVKSDKALRESEERFRALFDRGPIAMYACDAEGVIQEFNRNAVLLWGRQPTRGDSAERFCGGFKLLFPDGSPMRHAQSPIAAVLKGETPIEHGVEVIIERKDGTRSTIVANIVALKNAQGEITGAINCMYDITERKRLERMTLEQAQALSDLDRRKDEFLAMLSHELRNPLAPLSNAVQLLRLHRNEDPVQRQAHSIIERQVGQLKHLVDDLLETSRIKTGSVRLRQEQVSVAEIIDRAVETAQPLIVERRHELKVAMPPKPIFLHADPARLEQVLVNLLTNAAKYTDEGGCIWLSVEREGDANGMEAVLRVRDNGIGIAPELLPRIFDLFTQAERSLDRSQGGLGIGLSLVQRLVELHGGTVKAFSVPGQGSEFVVRLPMVPAAVAAAPPVLSHDLSTPERLATGRKVLVIDDNVEAVQSLAELLKLFGHEVQIAYDGPSGVQAAETMRPDVVLLDIGLPGLTGLEVAERIRRLPALDNTVLVALTGYGHDSDRQLSRDAGFDHHLVKPADFAEVQKILASVG